ncbi:MAG: hypothetical protein Q9217_003166 [Psora testacea]
MEYVQNIGQSYLDRKANQAPYQLENIVKKQLTGGNKEAANQAGKVSAQSPAGDAYLEDAVPAKKAPAAGSSEKDAELARLRKELAAYKLDQGNSKASAKSEEKGYGAEEAYKPSSKASKLEALDGRVEKGQISTKPKHSIQHQKKGSKAPNPLTGLEALDGRVEKGQISTRKPSKALAEANGSAGQRYSSASPVSTSRGRDKGASTTPGSQAGSARRPSSAASEVSSRRTSYDEPRSFTPSRRFDDEESEHGGSAALLHARERYRRRSSLGAVPEIPPLEKRPEVVGHGFRPHRSPPDRELGIVEVIEEPIRAAPRAREIHREPRRRRDGDEVVEVRKERDGRTLFKVR